MSKIIVGTDHRGKNVSLDLEVLLGSRLLLQANSGKGKSRRRMKSSERCSSRHQGDRCRFAKSHIIDGSSETDPMKSFHVGAFTVWDDYGVVKAKAQGAETRPGARRSRLANRVLRNLIGENPVVFNQDAVKSDLTKLEKFYRRPE